MRPVGCTKSSLVFLVAIGTPLAYLQSATTVTQMDGSLLRPNIHLPTNTLDKYGTFQPLERLRHLSFRSTEVRQGLNLYWARASAQFPFPNAITAALRCFTSSSVQGLRDLDFFLPCTLRAGGDSSAVLGGWGYKRTTQARDGRLNCDTHKSGKFFTKTLRKPTRIAAITA